MHRMIFLLPLIAGLAGCGKDDEILLVGEDASGVEQSSTLDLNVYQRELASFLEVAADACNDAAAQPAGGNRFRLNTVVIGFGAKASAGLGVIGVSGAASVRGIFSVTERPIVP